MHISSIINLTTGKMINNPHFTGIEESPEKYTYNVRELVDTPRKNPEENEDALLIHTREDGSISSLITDGATGVGGVVDPYKEGMANLVGIPAVSGGRFASLIVKQEVEQMIKKGMRSPKELLLYGAEKLREELQKLGIKEEHFTQVASTLGALTDLDPSGKMRWACVRSDVSIVVIHANGEWEWQPENHPLDYHEGKALTVALRNNPSDISRSLAVDGEVQTFINTTNRAGENTHTYGSINGANRETLSPWIAEGEMQMTTGDRLYLFTDGFLPEKPIHAYQTEEAFHKKQQEQRALVVDSLRAGGPEGLLALVRAQQQSDPTCTLYPRFKAVGDDATLIEIVASR